jgi:diguanylate cyclase (GGDEF)-like protein
LMLDLDHFKQLNDTYGHAAGDLVLQGCAELWQSLLRDQDLLGRIGGEEFCILLIETPPEAAARVAERLRATTAARRFELAGSDKNSASIGITVSIGMTWLGAADQEWNGILARADRALYQAKRQQRNQVVVMEPEAPDRQDAESVVNTPSA